MKQYNYKPRSNSTSSQDGSAAGSPPKSDSKQTPTSVLGQTSASGPTAGAAAGRRRVRFPVLTIFSISYSIRSSSRNPLFPNIY